MVAKSARFLAPIALAAVAVGIYLIVHHGLATQPVTTTQSSPLVNGRRATARAHKPTPKYYVVKQGDTLGGISVKTHVSIQRLTNLNPGLSTNGVLQTGQRLRLRR